MGIFQKIFGNSDNVNQRYTQIRESNAQKALQQARERNISIPAEPMKIAQMVPLPGHVDGELYWGVADFILAEYPAELALQVASSFYTLAPKIGFDAFGKIMVGAQYVDRKAGSAHMTRFSFMQEHPVFSQYISERDCPQRTQKAIDFLSVAVFQFPNADRAKQIFPSLLVVPEMKANVEGKLMSIDETVARYIIR